RLTGEGKFGNELERTFYNHLAAAQHPRGDDWCYYTALEGKKPYDKGINCCHSSGPRGMALAPLAAYLKLRKDGKDVIAISTFETSQARLGSGEETIVLRQESGFPRKGESVITVQTRQPALVGLQVRVPAWAAPLRIRVSGQAVEARLENGWAVLPARTWKDGDSIQLSFSLGASVVAGDHGNAGRAALAWGPFVLAYDEARNPGLVSAMAAGLAELAKPPFTLKPGEPLAFETKVVARRGSEPKAAVLVPFADAGAEGSTYRVWIRAPGAELPQTDSLLADGEESRSRQGNVSGSITDGSFESMVVTFDGRMTKEDWYAVALKEPVTIRRIVFAHGGNFHDGGWFNASAGKPKVQVRREKGGAWETVGELSSYPSTTATDNQGLKAGQPFTLRLAAAIKAVAVRISGVPASGDNPGQAFSSCAELEAFGE
ncbi:MAG: glycoside hydrolase family 127 protein, partial [Verrucomicrobia bacterium]|nr:glycoside hydrolase family 127 protein [Verrucomicrobiota bacterium]